MYRRLPASLGRKEEPIAEGSAVGRRHKGRCSLSFDDGPYRSDNAIPILENTGLRARFM